MKQELEFFMQPRRHQFTYRLLLLLGLATFEIIIYCFQPGPGQTLPFVFINAPQIPFLRLVLANMMTFVTYLVGLLLPLQHLIDFLIDNRPFVLIRRGRNARHFVVFQLLSFAYTSGYLVVTALFPWCRGYHTTAHALLIAIVFMSILTTIISMCALLGQYVLGLISSILILIIISGSTGLIGRLQNSQFGFGSSCLIWAALVIVAYRLYRNHELY